jgi:hypothetical protein
LGLPDAGGSGRMIAIDNDILNVWSVVTMVLILSAFAIAGIWTDDAG